MPYPLADGRDYAIFPRAVDDPTPLENNGKLYSKIIGGVAQLFYQADDGTVYQLTPTSGSASVQYQFVFDANAVAPTGNVYNDLLTLLTAAQAVEGEKTIFFVTDTPTYNVGNFDFTDCDIVGKYTWISMYVQGTATIVMPKRMFDFVIYYEPTVLGHVLVNGDTNNGGVNINTSFEGTSGLIATNSPAAGDDGAVFRLVGNHSFRLEHKSFFICPSNGPSPNWHFFQGMIGFGMDVAISLSTNAGLITEYPDAMFDSNAGVANYIIEGPGAMPSVGPGANGPSQGQRIAYMRGAYGDNVPSADEMVTTPATLTGNANDLNLQGLIYSRFIRIDADGAYTITGFETFVNGRQDVRNGLAQHERTCINISQFPLTLANESIFSSGQNRITTSTGGNLVIPPQGWFGLWYDVTLGNWRAAPKENATNPQLIYDNSVPSAGNRYQSLSALCAAAQSMQGFKTVVLVTDGNIVDEALDFANCEIIGSRSGLNGVPVTLSLQGSTTIANMPLRVKDAILRYYPTNGLAPVDHIVFSGWVSMTLEGKAGLEAYAPVAGSNGAFMRLSGFPPNRISLRDEAYIYNAPPDPNPLVIGTMFEIQGNTRLEIVGACAGLYGGIATQDPEHMFNTVAAGSEVWIFGKLPMPNVSVFQSQNVFYSQGQISYLAGPLTLDSENNRLSTNLSGVIYGADFGDLQAHAKLYQLNPTAYTRIETISAIQFVRDGHTPWVRRCVNVGTFPIVLVNESAGGVANDHILTSKGANLTCEPGQSFTLWYDTDVLRWRVAVDGYNAPDRYFVLDTEADPSGNTYNTLAALLADAALVPGKKTIAVIPPVAGGGIIYPPAGTYDFANCDIIGITANGQLKPRITFVNATTFTTLPDSIQNAYVEWTPQNTNGTLCTLAVNTRMELQNGGIFSVTPASAGVGGSAIDIAGWDFTVIIGPDSRFESGIGGIATWYMVNDTVLGGTFTVELDDCYGNGAGLIFGDDNLCSCDIVVLGQGQCSPFSLLTAVTSKIYRTTYSNTYPDVRQQVISPGAFNAQQNDYAPTGFQAAKFVRLTSTGAQNISGFSSTGFTGGENQEPKLLVNVGGSTITLLNNSASSLAANRLFCPGGANRALTAGSSAWLWYDATSGAWRVTN